jgi:DNA-binding LacI/PurR family transcriptional regulator
LKHYLSLLYIFMPIGCRDVSFIIALTCAPYESSIMPQNTETQNRARIVTLKDIASELGVHHSTVSRALRKDPQVSKSIQEKAARVAERMGYKPDPVMQALSRYRLGKLDRQYLGTLAWLVNECPKQIETRKPGFMMHFESSQKVAEQSGYKLQYFYLKEKGMTTKRMRDILRSRGICGVLLPPQPLGGTSLKMDFSSFSVMTIGNTLASPQFNKVGPSQYANSYSMAKRLLEDENRMVGIYLPRTIDKRSDGRFSSGFWRAQQEIPESRRIPICLPDAYCESEFKNWFKEHRPNTLISTPEPTYEWLTRLGIDIPGEVENYFPADQPDDHICAYIQEDWPRIYHTAVVHLIGQVERGELGIPVLPHRVTIRGSWVDGRLARPAQSTSLNP